MRKLVRNGAKMCSECALATLLALVLIDSERRNFTVLTRTRTLSPQQYQTTFAQRRTPHVLLDVRTAEEFAGGHIAGAVNLPVQTLAQQLPAVPKDRPLVLYCRSGNRTKLAAQILTQAGYTDLYDLGGILRWQAQGFPVR